MNYTQIVLELQFQWQISERFARNPLLLAQPQTFVLHQILRHVSSSEISIDNKFRFGYQDGYGGCLIGVSLCWATSRMKLPQNSTVS